MERIDFTIKLTSERFGVYRIPDEEEPLGWDSFKILLRRHEKYHGIFPEISLKLKFFCGAREYILKAYTFDGVEANVKIYVFAGCEPQDLFYQGYLDFRDLAITERFVECNIQQLNCIDLFLQRTGVKVNLYDEPCFTELTYDKTAYRTRYKYAPYWIAFPEKTIHTITQWRARGCETKGTGVCYQDGAKHYTSNKFQLNGGLGCSLTIAIDPQDPTTYQICSNTDAPENNDNAQSPWQNANGDYIYYIVNGSALEKIIDDISFLSPSFLPQGYQAPINATNNIQYHRNCGNEDEGLATVWDEENQYNGAIPDVCVCCINENSLPCKDFVFHLDIAVDIATLTDIVEGIVEWIQYEHELVFELGNYQQILTSTPRVTETNGCSGWDDNNDLNSGCCGSPACLFFTGEIAVPACNVSPGDKFRIYTRTAIGFKAGGSLLGASNLSIQVWSFWKKNDGTLLTQDCIKDAPRVGETAHPVYMVHESFSRLVEYYTNNCLRVKSSLFARPNSMEWADRCDIQNSAIRDYSYISNAPGMPVEFDECGVPLWEKFRETLYCAPATRECDCDNPQPFPKCNQTFDPKPYAVNQILGAGRWYAEAFTAITSGISLRDFGTECFVSFDELFDAMNALYCIGVGYSDADLDNLYIERIDYFYQDTVVFDFRQVDKYESKWTERVVFDAYFNKFEVGYNSWLQDKFNTIDEFLTKREYSLPLKNVSNSISSICNFIASGYSIEWQRRQRYSIDSELDSEIFVICVGRSVNPYNVNTISVNGQFVYMPAHMWRAEQGVDNASGLIDPTTTYNFRIAPHYMASYWEPVWAPPMWHKNPRNLTFAAGEANFTAAGAPPFSADLTITYAKTPMYHAENDDVFASWDSFLQPEEITFNYPLSVAQFRRLRKNIYGAVSFNNKIYYIKEIEFSFLGESKITLIKARKQ